MCFGEPRRQPECPLVAAHTLLQASRHLAGVAQIIVCSRRIRRDLERAPVFGDGFPGAALLHQQVAQIVVRQGEIGSRSGGPLEPFDRRRPVSLPVSDNAAQVKGARMTRVGREDFRTHLARFGESRTVTQIARQFEGLGNGHGLGHNLAEYT